MTTEELFKEIIISEDEVDDPDIIKNLKHSTNTINYFSDIEIYFQKIREQFQKLGVIFSSRV